MGSVESLLAAIVVLLGIIGFKLYGIADQIMACQRLLALLCDLVRSTAPRANIAE